MKKQMIVATCLLMLMLGMSAAQPLPPAPTDCPLPPMGSGEPAMLAMFDELPPMDLVEVTPDVPEEPASEPGPGKVMMRGARPMRMPELSIEQRRRMAALKIQFRKDVGSLPNDLAIKKLELNALWLDDELNEDKIVAKSKEIWKVENQLQEKRLRNRLTVFKILTPDQRQQMQMHPRGMIQRGRGARPMQRGLMQ